MRNYQRMFETSKLLCMEKLLENEHKGPWDNMGETKEMNVAQLFKLLEIEVKELEHATLFEDERSQTSEATDVCNIAMMIQDVLLNRE
jgi:hypothetical protein